MFFYCAQYCLSVPDVVSSVALCVTLQGSQFQDMKSVVLCVEEKIEARFMFFYADRYHYY